ncbi:DUF3052 domain-containing protein [Nocardioides sp.]|uniref:DUF3052 domain-containing protein n=1 Tax=Nocardioides sp. TaxID=35761 RepID=UPI00286AE368|nr:DUF3052 domain-containing protein [Nocardioides sp.]
MAGYSATPLVTKIGVRAGHTLLLDRAPADLDLGDLAGVTVVRRLARSADVTLTFHTHLASLTARLPVLLERTGPAGMVWVCWPKLAAQKARRIDADLDEGEVRALGLDLGWVDVKVAAVDEVWSGLKLVRRLVDR